MNSGREQTREDGLRAAYERLDWRMVEVHENLSVPSATPVRFEYDGSPGVTDAKQIERRFDDSALSFIDVLAQNGEKWYEFSYSAQVYEDDANEFCNLSVSTAGVTILRKQHPLSFETFERVVELVEYTMGTTLTPEERDPDG